MKSKLAALPSSRGSTIIQVSTTMAISRIMSFKNNVEPRFMNRPPRLVSGRGTPYHRDLSFVNMFLSFYLVSADDPWRGRHQAGGILSQGGSEGEPAVGSKLALKRAPTVCRRR